MVQVTTVHKHLKCEQWKSIITECCSSGMTVTGTAKHMLGDITVAENINICGYTDMRKSIDGLAAIVQQQFYLEPFSNTFFLFCRRHRNRMKVPL